MKNQKIMMSVLLVSSMNIFSSEQAAILAQGVTHRQAELDENRIERSVAQMLEQQDEQQAVIINQVTDLTGQAGGGAVAVELVASSGQDQAAHEVSILKKNGKTNFSRGKKILQLWNLVLEQHPNLKEISELYVNTTRDGLTLLFYTPSGNSTKFRHVHLLYAATGSNPWEHINASTNPNRHFIVDANGQAIQDLNILERVFARIYQYYCTLSPEEKLAIDCEKLEIMFHENSIDLYEKVPDGYYLFTTLKIKQ